ncbi:MAG: glycosyltransferase [Fibromonadales bacterium]|nr:glycosyltransferase [Fibromonadales bacterium]
MKYIYCLISTVKDIYYEQAFISITSLRMHTPNAFVTLFTDKETIDSIENRKADIRKIADEVIIENFESKVSNFKRSRMLKTAMRNRIEGDFLYIDSDTVVCQDLSEIGDINFELGAVLDGHTLNLLNFRRFSVIVPLKRMLNKADFYDYPYYFNSGLLFVRDTKCNRIFFEKWSENYFLGCQRGVRIDQPSLALTNYQSNFPIKELDGRWNVQVWNGANYLHNAKIMHYYASDDSEYEPFSRTLPLKLKEMGCLTEDELFLVAQPRGFFGKAAFIAVGDDYEICRSNIGGLLRKLYKHKFLFKLIDKIFALPRMINARLYSRRRNK